MYINQLDFDSPNTLGFMLGQRPLHDDDDHDDHDDHDGHFHLSDIVDLFDKAYFSSGAESIESDIFLNESFQNNFVVYSQFEPGKALFADIPGDTSSTATVAVNGSISDTLEVANDEDWFMVTLTAGQRYIIALDGSGASPLSDPLVRLLDSSGNQLALNDDGGPGLNSSLSYTATETGTFFISAEAYSTQVGDYTLSVTEAAPIGLRTVDEIAHFLTDEFSTRASYAQTTITFNIDGLVEGAQALALRALEAWADVTPLNFVATTLAQADLVFQNTDSGAYNSNSYSGGSISSGIINISSNWNGGSNNLDSYTYQTYLHEIGHALGLGHAGPYNGSATYGVDNVYLNDSWAYTVMSYFSQSESSYFGDYRFVLGPQIADIIAIQDLYGANTTTRNEDTVYGFNSTEGSDDIHNFAQFNRAPSLSIYDTGGIDTLDFSGYSQDQNIDLNPEAFSDVDGIRGVISIARGTIIENAIGGSGIDTIVGNSDNNILTGNAGNDILDGGDGIDYAAYNLNSLSDYTVVDNGGGSYTITANSGNEGSDTISNIEYLLIDGISHALGTPSNLFSQGDDIYNGTQVDEVLDGLGGNDIINAAAGNDTLIGGAGADALDGGAGLFDVADYSSSAAGVTVRLYNGTGTGGDAQGDTLTNIEGIVGSAFADILIGSSIGVDTLSGGAGNDLLFGLAGNDILNGGAGADTLDGGASLFDVADYSDSSAGVTVRLYNGTGAGGDAQGDTLSGIEVIEGSDFADILIGSSIQIDTIRGGAGNDLLYGLAGNDTLIGGAGADILDGGASNADTADYSDSATGVTVRLYNGTGLGGDAQGDTLVNIEGVRGSAHNDTLIGSSTQTDILRGGDGFDSLFGLAGNDILDGGNGNDSLTGGAGNDLFIFADGFGQDTITDFADGFDRFDVSGIAGVTSIADFTITQEGADVLIVLDANNTITLENTLLADIDANDFVF